MESSFVQSYWSLLPPLLAIALAVSTRRVLLSLGLGIVLAALLLQEFNPLYTVQLLFSSAVALVWSDGAVNEWNVNILIFLLLLGCIISMLGRVGTGTH